MSKANIILIVLILGILIFGWAIFNINVINSFKKPSSSSTRQNPSPNPTTSTEQAIVPPISLSNTNFNEAIIGYEFLGKITSLKRGKDNRGNDYAEITLSPSIQGMPKYFRIFEENRIIFLKGRTEFKLARLSDLSDGQNIRIATGYVIKTQYYKLHDWKTMYVQIIVNQLPNSTSPTPITPTP